MASIRKRGLLWYYAFIDGDGRRVERKGCTNRRATEEMAAHAEAEAAMIRVGLADPRDFAYRDADRKTIADHLDAWKSDMLAKGRSEKHARTFRYRAGRVVELAEGEEIERPCAHDPPGRLGRDAGRGIASSSRPPPRVPRSGAWTGRLGPSSTEWPPRPASAPRS